MPHTACVQTYEKHRRLLRNSGVAFVPNPSLYGPCKPSRLSHYVAYKSARRSGPYLRFLDIESPNAPQHPMFKEEKKTGVLKKLIKREKAAGHQNNQNSPSKRKAKTTGKRTRPSHKLQPTRGLQTEENIETPQRSTREMYVGSGSHNDDNSSTTSEDIAPSPKRPN